nr:MAG TPA: hypothetical protein [Caudoviricetes sp.]
MLQVFHHLYRNHPCHLYQCPYPYQNPYPCPYYQYPYRNHPCHLFPYLCPYYQNPYHQILRYRNHPYHHLHHQQVHYYFAMKLFCSNFFSLISEDLFVQ